MEQPSLSLLFITDVFREILSLPCVFSVKFDQCQFGGVLAGEGCFRKRTAILTNSRPLLQLRKLCPGGHQHIKLEGSWYDPELRKWTARTRSAGAYPRLLCKRMAELMADTVESVT